MTLAKEDVPPPASTVNDTLLSAISRTYFDMLPAFEQHMGMTRARWHLLAVLGREQQLSQAQLTQRLRVDAAAVTRQVKQLEEEGFVTRRADPADNRFTLVTLTATGRQIFEDLCERRDRLETIAMAGLSDDEIELTKRCLARIRTNVTALTQ